MAESLQHSYGIRHLIALIILFTATFATLTTAAPIDVSPNTSSLIARNGQCPSIDSMREHMRKRGMPTASTVFYTTPAEAGDAKGFAEALTPPGNYFEDFFTFADVVSWADACGDNVAEQEKIVLRASIALAREASGIAYVVTRGTPGDDSIWKMREFPSLQWNPRITEVHRFDLDTQEYTLIWRGGDAPTGPENIV
ncbi:hypothetical protein NLJ89_g6722 [Agrocybe chaxingu]|uniref:Uncharacterized protein n=1 Tax=Agrocybe chaxingu TaxID=84603 RepID=A0A9W8K0B2_9AGAR|nr:hypothetical protein NLJ89_g6722 [Agrocybe chaxingu]